MILFYVQRLSLLVGHYFPALIFLLVVAFVLAGIWAGILLIGRFIRVGKGK